MVPSALDMSAGLVQAVTAANLNFSAFWDQSFFHMLTWTSNPSAEKLQSTELAVGQTNKAYAAVSRAAT
jgi:hypothetical protein